jgi:hypothetical protein
MELTHPTVQRILAVVATVKRVALVFHFVELVGLNNPKGNFELLAELFGDLQVGSFQTGRIGDDSDAFLIEESLG